MRRIYISILIVSTLLLFESCSLSQWNSLFKHCPELVYELAPEDQDSLCLLPETKYFYRYKTEVVGRDYDLDWVISNLYCLHGITVMEAWYGTGRYQRTEEGITRVIDLYGPPLTIGMPTDTSDIWRYHFELDTLFDPARAFENKVTHLIFKGFKQDSI